MQKKDSGGFRLLSNLIIQQDNSIYTPQSDLIILFHQSEEISFLQRCTSLHPWNYQYWYLLALAYEKASLSLLEECSNSDLHKVHSVTCVCYQDGKEKDFPNKSSKGGLLAKEECSEQYFSEHVEVMKESLENVNVAGKVETASEVLELSKTFYCENCTSADYRKNKTNSGLFLSERKQLHLMDTFCDCLATLKPDTEHKMKWRKHILSFGCLVKSRFVEKFFNASKGTYYPHRFNCSVPDSDLQEDITGHLL